MRAPVSRSRPPPLRALQRRSAGADLEQAQLLGRQKSRCTSKPIARPRDLTSPPLLVDRTGEPRANDNDRCVLAAHPGKSQGRPPSKPELEAHRPQTACNPCVPIQNQLQTTNSRFQANWSTDQPERTLGVCQPRQPAALRPAAANGLGVQSRPVEHRQADDAVARGAAIAECRYRRRDSDPLR
jgi:hypothetical protein